MKIIIIHVESKIPLSQSVAHKTLEGLQKTTKSNNLDKNWDYIAKFYTTCQIPNWPSDSLLHLLLYPYDFQDNSPHMTKSLTLQKSKSIYAEKT